MCSARACRRICAWSHGTSFRSGTSTSSASPDVAAVGTKGMDATRCSMGRRRTPGRAHVVGLLALLLLVPAIFGPLVNHLMRSPGGDIPANTDYPVHNALAARMRQ